MSPTGPTYPTRPPFFAYRFCRLMAKVCLANEVGPAGCWLLTVIAQTEDAKSYRGPVSFFNEQLYPLVGLGSVSALVRLRDRCIRAGWLYHLSGTNRRAARYWVVVPEQYSTLDDGPSDERPGKYFATAGDKRTGDEAAENRRRSGDEPVVKRRRSGGEAAANRQTTIPYPSPDPKGKDTPIPPPAVNEMCVTEPAVTDPPEPGLVAVPRLDVFVDAWNGVGLISVSASSKLRGLWQKRWGEDADFRARWRAAVERAGRSARCRGERGDWRATPEWFIRDADSVARILDRGEFDDPPDRGARQTDYAVGVLINGTEAKDGPAGDRGTL